MSSHRILALAFVFLLTLSCGPDKGDGALSADIVIYGGTSAAIIAAVEATRSGQRVIVISPDTHLGGLSSGGLGYTDTGKKEVIGGLARDFYHRVYQHYDKPEAWQWEERSAYGNRGQGTPAIDGDARTMWIFEPHVAEKVFEDYVREDKITVYRNEWLDRERGVEKKGAKIVSITTLSGKKYTGRIFIDATYEGDLMAAAEIPFHVGREANSQYGEKWNGVQTEVFHHRHHFMENIDPYLIPGDSTSGLVYGVSAEPPGEKGEADHRLQAYCFRMCLSDHPDNRVPFQRPADYDSTRYELLARVFAKGWDETFNKFDRIPNRKTDTNNHGPFSTDFIGMNYDYPVASYEERRKIILAHEQYQKGLLYFLSTDSRVPAKVREQMSTWGLAKDEFTDNDNWPHQIYVREARRMIGHHVMTEHEVLGSREVEQPVGMGSYTLDSHNVQRYVKDDGYVQNEGDIGIHIEKPYQISYGSIIPKKSDCENLLVPVCLSSTHIAYGSIRMEPVFMILGQAAAAAAALANENERAVQDVSYEVLRDRLIRKGAVLSN